MIPTKAFILAAGFGKRMRPLTDERPKPMIEVHGQSLIMHAIDQLKEAGITDILVNTHYLGDVLANHLKARSDVQIHISHEDEILETGGGIKNALEFFGGEDFFVLSGDGLWIDHENQSCIKDMIKAWDPEKMDILMLLQPTETMTLTKGVGDYHLDNHGRAVRALDQSGTHMFTSMRINRASIFDNSPDGYFSYLKLMDEAQEKSRLYGLINQGMWHHISTPEDLASVEKGENE